MMHFSVDMQPELYPCFKPPSMVLFVQTNPCHASFKSRETNCFRIQLSPEIPLITPKYMELGDKLKMTHRSFCILTVI
jgi:hypothetical protein